MGTSSSHADATALYLITHNFEGAVRRLTTAAALRLIEGGGVKVATEHGGTLALEVAVVHDNEDGWAEALAKLAAAVKLATPGPGRPGRRDHAGSPWVVGQRIRVIVDAR